MNYPAPVLTDLFGNEFTVGDRVVYAASNGIRVGIVDHIKEIDTLRSFPRCKVYINMSEHHGQSGPAQMRAKRVGYLWTEETYSQTSHHFLKV